MEDAHAQMCNILPEDCSYVELYEQMLLQSRPVIGKKSRIKGSYGENQFSPEKHTSVVEIMWLRNCCVTLTHMNVTLTHIHT